jgi:hypothetical protein
MVSDQQVRKLMSLLSNDVPLSTAALKSGMDEKTARKYRRTGTLPGAQRARHDWRSRPDPFAEVWPELKRLLKANPGLQATTLLAELQRREPGSFADGQLRTLQRKLKTWRAQEGPAKEVFFAQEHQPGELGASDFCHLSELGVCIGGQAFPHLLYHFVLTYSNWETGGLCFSESFESLSAGLQDAFWQLGGVPSRHRTDSLSAAIQPPDSPEEFRRCYTALLEHYGVQGERIQIGKANENGDIEQRHHRFKVALDQALMLRGSRDFESREAYALFVRRLFAQLNAGRAARLQEERRVLRALPFQRLDTRKHFRVRVGPGSSIRVQHNVYSVPSRLIGEWVDVRLGVEDLELWYAQRLVECLPRLRGEKRHHITYRHIIDWLVRKPGAFAAYRYREDLFPSSRFRVAYDHLRSCQPLRADKEYLAILLLAARESEERVEAALCHLLSTGEPLSSAAIAALIGSAPEPPLDRAPLEVEIAPVNLSIYDGLLQEAQGWATPLLSQPLSSESLSQEVH